MTGAKDACTGVFAIPWASLILKAGKNIENRDWPTKYRGRIPIHAAKGMTRAEHEDAINFAVEAIKVDPRNVGAERKTTLRDLASPSRTERGGIVGSVEIVACVTDSTSPWFVGKFHAARPAAAAVHAVEGPARLLRRASSRHSANLARAGRVTAERLN